MSSNLQRYEVQSVGYPHEWWTTIGYADERTTARKLCQLFATAPGFRAARVIDRRGGGCKEIYSVRADNG